MLRRTTLILLLTVLPLLPALAGEPAPAPNDRAALHGLATGRAVFDVRIGDVKQLLFALKVIDETAAGMSRQGVAPDFVVTFRGATLPLLKRGSAGGSPEERAILAEVHERLAEFRSRKTPLEACNVAARLFKIEAVDLDPSLQLVGNSIVSLIGYQQQGYVLVPMY